MPTQRRLTTKVPKPPSAYPPPSLKVSIQAEIMDVDGCRWSLDAFDVDLDALVGWMRGWTFG